MKATTIKIDELKDVLKIVELQRELVVSLSSILESQKIVNEKIKKLNVIAKNLQTLKDTKKSYRAIDKLTDEEKKEVRKLLKERHLRI